MKRDGQRYTERENSRVTVRAEEHVVRCGTRVESENNRERCQADQHIIGLRYACDGGEAVGILPHTYAVYLHTLGGEILANCDQNIAA